MRFGIGRKTILVVMIALLTIVSSACAQLKEAKMKAVSAHEENGRNLRLKGDFDGALREQQKAVELAPNNTEAWLLLASIYADLQNWNKAIEATEKSISLNQNDARSYNVLGFCYERLGDKKKALEYKKETVRLDPNNLLYLVNLGLSYDLLNDRKSAREYISKALQINPDYAYAWYQLADLEVDDGNLQKAIELFQKVSKLKATKDQDIFDDSFFIENANERIIELKKELEKKKQQ